jgi:hypothetical protein
VASKTKVCSRCGEAKVLSEFYEKVGGAQGRRGMCKVCFRAAQRAAWARNPNPGGVVPVGNADNLRFRAVYW